MYCALKINVSDNRNSILSWRLFYKFTPSIHQRSTLSKPFKKMDKYDDIILNLKILSKIPRNGRIRKSNLGKVTLEDEGYLLSLRRRYYADSRRQAVNDITLILNDAFDETHKLLESRYLMSSRENGRDRDFIEDQFTIDKALGGDSGTSSSFEDRKKRILDKLSIMYRELSRSTSGLENLRSTYTDDVSTVSALDWMVDKIQLELAEIRNKCPSLVSEDANNS